MADMLPQMYELLGHKQFQIEQQAAAYDDLLEMLANVVSGRIDRSRVLVNLTERSYHAVEYGHRPVPPVTLNGLPKYVVSNDLPFPMQFTPQAVHPEQSCKILSPTA